MKDQGVQPLAISLFLGYRFPVVPPAQPPLEQNVKRVVPAQVRVELTQFKGPLKHLSITE
jgi:hypothetical protein